MQESSESLGLHDDEDQRGPLALDPVQLGQQIVQWIGSSVDTGVLHRLVNLKSCVIL